MRKSSDRMMAHYVITNTASLLLKCAAFMDDTEFAIKVDDRHRETYYAVDTDVINLYLNPESRAFHFDIFGRPSSPTPKQLAFIVGDFLFKSSLALVQGQEKHKCRFLVVSPHDKELLEVLSAIHRELLGIADNIGLSKFNELSEVLKEYENGGDKLAFLNSLRSHVPDLVELYNPYRGPRAALARFSELPQTTFQTIATYLEDGFAFPLLDPVNNNVDRKIANELITRWELLLGEKQKRQEQPKYAIQRDAEVLATLEYVNRELLDAKKQVVLITGSSYLFEAADNYFPQSDLFSQKSFADMYIRDTQAFLAHPGMFSLQHFNVVDWLNLFFPTELYPELRKEGSVNRISLRNILKGKDRSYNHIVDVLSRSTNNEPPIERLITEWEKQVSTVAQSRYADGLEKAAERGATELASKLVSLREKKLWSLGELSGLIFSESLASVRTLYTTSGWLGLWSKVSRVQSKGIPALRFYSKYVNIKTYCEKVIALQLKGASKPISLEELKILRDLSEHVRVIDPTLYHSLIIDALAFAIKGHWNATLTLVRTAMAICDSLDTESRATLLGGGEAALLASVAKRRSARNRSDLRSARRYLDDAIRREGTGAAEDIRFTSEQLVLETRKYYFDFFCEGEKLSTSNVTKILNYSNKLVRKANSEKDATIRRWVLTQTLVNYFTLLLICRDLKWNTIVSAQHGGITDKLVALRTILDNVSAYSHKPENDPYAHLVWNISAAVWASDEATRMRAKSNADGVIKTWGAFVAPYDEQRFSLLKRALPESQ